jgi:hypothetical protein
LWTFHFCVATVQQHLNMEYTFLIWYNIPEHGFLDRGLALTRKLLHQRFLVITVEVIITTFYARRHDLVNRYIISVSQITADMIRLWLSQSRNPWLTTGIVTSEPRRMQLVEQKLLLTLLEHLNSSLVFCQLLLILFRVATVLSVLWLIVLITRLVSSIISFNRLIL